MRSFSAFPSSANLASVVQRRGPCKDFAERSKVKSFKIHSGLNFLKKSIQRDRNHFGHYSLGAPNSTEGPQSNLATFSYVNWTHRCLVGCWID